MSNRSSQKNKTEFWLKLNAVFPVRALFLLFILTCLIPSISACSGGESATKDGFLPSEFAKIRMLLHGVNGPPPDLAQQFDTIFAQQVGQRGFQMTDAKNGSVQGGGPFLQLRPYIHALSQDGKENGFAWLLDVSEDGRVPVARNKGIISATGENIDPWQGFTQDKMRSIAQASLDHLMRHLSQNVTSTSSISE